MIIQLVFAITFLLIKNEIQQYIVLERLWILLCSLNIFFTMKTFWITWNIRCIELTVWKRFSLNIDRKIRRMTRATKKTKTKLILIFSNFMCLYIKWFSFVYIIVFKVSTHYTRKRYINFYWSTFSLKRTKSKNE